MESEIGQKDASAGALLPGTLDLLILNTLARGARHGHAIIRFIEQTSGEKIRVEEGALYPALHRMEARGWVTAEPGISENKRRAKFYKLTEEGSKQLSNENRHWNQVTEAIGRILQASAS